MIEQNQLAELLAQALHGVGPDGARPTSEALMTPVQDPDENPRIEFRDGQLLFTMTNMEGGLVERFISDAAAREAFSGIPIDSGWLRPEVVRWGDGKHGEWAIAFIPPGVHELELTSETTADGGPPTVEGAAAPPEPVFNLERINVPLPGLVFFGLAQVYFIYAVKTPKLDPYHEIYRAPLPNIYSNGSVCWGLVKPPRATARTIFDAFDLFMKSTFNNHLASGKSKQLHPEDVRQVLRSLSAESKEESAGSLSPYPTSDLMRQVEHVGITLDKAIREFFQTGEMPG